jgi:hypothetical protein
MLNKQYLELCKNHNINLQDLILIIITEGLCSDAIIDYNILEKNIIKYKTR